MHSSWTDIPMNDIWPDMPRRERDAYYHAGHAVVALRESLEVVVVSIQEEDGASSTGVYQATVEYCELLAGLAGEYADLRPHRDHPRSIPIAQSGTPLGMRLRSP